MADSVRLRRPGPDDAAPLAAVHEACWREAYAGLVPADVIDAQFADHAARVARWEVIVGAGSTWVAELVTGGSCELVGFASSGPARDGDPPRPLELYAIYTRAAVWDAGVGHRLLGAAIGDDPAYLWVLAGNARAVRFYERHGFALDGTTHDDPAGVHARMTRDAGGPLRGRGHPSG